MTATATLALPGQLFLVRVLTARTPRPGQIRKDLALAGIILEDTKEGVRWKRQ